ncbi:hypothetical protein ACHAXT_006596 [Thalassiosira profunda]
MQSDTRNDASWRVAGVQLEGRSLNTAHRDLLEVQLFADATMGRRGKSKASPPPRRAGTSGRSRGRGGRRGRGGCVKNPNRRARRPTRRGRNSTSSTSSSSTSCAP